MQQDIENESRVEVVSCGRDSTDWSESIAQ